MDALNAFPALRELRLTGNPVVAANAHTRHEVVARVSCLRLLNGALVGKLERKEAEIRYLRRALDQRGELTAESAALESHPRMAQLLVRWLDPSFPPFPGLRLA